VVAITAARPDNTGLDKFDKEHKGRMFDVGIAEQHAVTFAAGLATQGIKPFVTIYSTFLQRAYDQIIHDVALQKLPVRFALDRGGIVGEDGPTHHGTFDLSYLRLIPDLVVMAPKDENELRHMVKTMASYDEGPSVIRFPRGNGHGVTMDKRLRKLPIGKGEVVRQGREVVLFAIGSMVATSMRAADILAEKGIDATVVNARFVKPLDVELVDEVLTDEPVLITVEENAVAGGFGSGVNEYLVSQGYDTSYVRNLGIPDKFIEHGNRDALLTEIGLTAEAIAQISVSLLKEQKRVFKPAKPAAG
jgi:1-deoxy-D-xylulose-5-phosphate synthase